jgi:hypothetical protein
MNDFHSLSVNRMNEGIDHKKFVIATYEVSTKKSRRITTKSKLPKGRRQC